MIHLTESLLDQLFQLEKNVKITVQAMDYVSMENVNATANSENHVKSHVQMAVFHAI